MENRNKGNANIEEYTLDLCRSKLFMMQKLKINSESTTIAALISKTRMINLCTSESSSKTWLSLIEISGKIAKKAASSPALWKINLDRQNGFEYQGNYQQNLYMMEKTASTAILTYFHHQVLTINLSVVWEAIVVRTKVHKNSIWNQKTIFLAPKA